MSQDVAAENGLALFEVHDFTAMPGVLWALPSVTPATGKIEVENTRYGSLCHFDVRANVARRAATPSPSMNAGDQITLNVTFTERLALCTSEIRALRYTAIVPAAAGLHEVIVVHTDGARADTLVRRTVEVK